MVADVVLDEQEPPYVIVPASVELKVYSGEVSLVGVVTAVTYSSVTAVESTMNDVIVSELLTFPEESVTIIVQFEYVPSLKETKVMVLFPDVAEVVLEEQ